MQKLTLVFLLSLAVVSCSSSKKYEDERHEDIERDYVVKDSNSKYRPGWIEDAQGWANENNEDTKTNWYYSNETEPKVGRKIACNLAKANAKSDIAGEIATKINTELMAEINGNSSIDENNPEVKALMEKVQSEMSASVSMSIHGAKVRKTYWEKRFYQKDLGAKKDYNAYTCAALIQIPRANLNRGIEQVEKKLETVTKEKMSREDVRRAVARAKEDLKI